MRRFIDWQPYQAPKRLNPLSLLPVFTALTLTIFLALSLPGCQEAPPPPIDPDLEAVLANVDPDALASHIQFLADDALEGRAAGTGGYDRAAQYVAERFAEYGLKPAGDAAGFFQQVPLLRADPIADGTMLQLQRDGQSTSLEIGVDALVQADFTREKAELTAPLAFVGYGVSAPQMDYDDYAGIDVHGKIVVQFRGAPAKLPTNQRAYHASPWVKRQEAVDRGAVGLLTVPTPHDRDRAPWARRVAQAAAGSMRWLEAGGNPKDGFQALFVDGMLNDSAAALLFENAPTLLQDTFDTAQASTPQAFDLVGELKIRTASRHTPARSANVVARLPGSDPDLAAEVVVLTAHADHLGVGAPVDGDAIYNGAYDNASGVAVLLEVARLFASMPTPPARSLVFAAVTAEERGLLGSDYLAHHSEQIGGEVVANLNMDMVMMLNPLSAVVGFGLEHSTLAASALLATSQLGLELEPDPFPEQVVFIRSDQYSFVRRGVPALMLAPAPGPSFGSWLGSVYHSPADDLTQEMDLKAGADFVRLKILMATHVANAPERPAWNPDDFFGDVFGTP